MVVLEEGSMLTTGHNQYLQPDYLSPLPTTVSIVALYIIPFFFFFFYFPVRFRSKNTDKGKKFHVEE